MQLDLQALFFLFFIFPPCHTRVTRHADHLEADKVVSWRGSGEND